LKFTTKQEQAKDILGSNATHIMCFGGSRSGKTFLIVWSIVTRALAAPGSRHAVLRFRFNHVKASVILDTFPKVMQVCYPNLTYHLDKSDWYVQFPNGSQIWFGGLDDKERTEKILGQEYATIFLNECSQIPYSSRNLAITRLAQKSTYKLDSGEEKTLRRKMYYDCNPPANNHWTCQLFVNHRDPETKQHVDSVDYASIRMNPDDNTDNLPEGYLKTLEGLPVRLQKRFLRGEFADATANALWTDEIIERWREYDPPQMQRIIVAVDPSGADDETSDADEIGIMVGGLGVDGYGYLLEDLTLLAGPSQWGKVATSAYDRHQADKIVGEKNFGGAMVRHVIQTARPNTPYSDVTASRGKAVRAEPISALHEQGKIRFVGSFAKLEDELCSFTTTGYIGQGSPNRADAFVWLMTELFPGMTKEAKKPVKKRTHRPQSSWMAA
jgi:phage terminase large subunit-like protein